MFDSKDFLFIILAFCTLWFTAFACWFIFQIALVIKNINKLLGDVKYQFERVDQTLNAMKAKFHEGADHLNKLADDVKKYVATSVKGKVIRD